MACWRERLFWRGLIHDWQKWLPREFFPYAVFFGKHNPRDKTGYYKPTDTGSRSFDAAWMHHVHHGDHHWQHWCVATEGELKVHEMPRAAIVEMLCDWDGAGRAQNATTSVREWFDINKHKMRFAPLTAYCIENMLSEPKWNRKRAGGLPC
jgi:hypothetical protein